MGLIERKKARIAAERQGVYAPSNNLVKVGSETVPHLNAFAAKFVLSSFFVKTKCIPNESSSYFFMWYTKETLQLGEIPTEISSMLGPAEWLSQGKNDARLHFECRNAYNESDEVFAVLARFNGSLIVLGFLVQDDSRIESKDGWWASSTAIEEAMKFPRRAR